MREVRGETGVWASIREELGCVAYSVKDKPVGVQYYVMEDLKEETPTDRGRKSIWLPIDRALDRTRQDEIHRMLRAADPKCRALLERAARRKRRRR